MRCQGHPHADQGHSRQEAVGHKRSLVFCVSDGSVRGMQRPPYQRHNANKVQNLTNVQRKGTFIAHHHGANALLQLRTVEQYYSDPISARVYEVAYAQMVTPPQAVSPQC